MNKLPVKMCGCISRKRVIYCEEVSEFYLQKQGRFSIKLRELISEIGKVPEKEAYEAYLRRQGSFSTYVFTSVNMVATLRK